MGSYHAKDYDRLLFILVGINRPCVYPAQFQAERQSSFGEADLCDISCEHNDILGLDTLCDVLLAELDGNL